MPEPDRVPLTDYEMAQFDAIKQVATSPRPRDLQLWRMALDGRQVAVIVQRVIDGTTAEEVGFQPIAMLLDDETTLRLRSWNAGEPQVVDPEGLEGAA